MIDALQTGITGVLEDITEFVSDQPTQAIAIGLGSAGAIAGIGLGVGALVKGVKKRRKKVKKKTRKVARRTKKAISRDRRFRSKQKHELAYVRRKRKAGKKITRPKYKTSRSRKRVGKTYFTKKGQPYKIMASGKAKFIKKSKGGRR